MTSQEPAAPRRDSPPLQPIGSACLTALTAVTVISLCRVFPDWEYLGGMLAVVLATHAFAVLLRVARTPLLLAIPLLLAAILELISIVYYRDTLNGPLPSGRTFELLRIDFRLVFEQFPTAVAPVPSVGSYATVTALALALCAALSDTFAFRALGRLEAVVPSGVIFVFTSALGTDRHRVVVAALWIGTALLTVAVLRFRHSSDQAAWMGARSWGLTAALPAIVITFGLSAVVAAAVGPRLPGAGEEALVDTRNRDGSVTEVLSPLVDIGAELRRSSNLEWFTVRSSDGPHYWRTFASPQFDGEQWSPISEDLEDMGDRSGDVLLVGPVTQQEIVILGLGGNTVPAAFQPISVNPGRILWTESTQMLVLPQPDALQRNDRLTVVSMVPRPSAEQLRNASVDNAPQGTLDLPPGLRSTITEQAAAVAGGAATPFDKAIALQNWFRTFRYDLTVQYGNSYDAIEAFLRDRAGFCQQFAGTFAVMARTLGLPSRVAVGTTPGELRSDGLYHVYGRNAHSWPEIWFDGIGWVAFEPTPGRGSPDAAEYTGVAPAQATASGSPAPGTGSQPTGPVPQQNGSDPEASTTVAGGRPGDDGAGGSVPDQVGQPAGGGGGDAVPTLVLLGLLCAAVAWMVFAPRAVRARARQRASTPRERVIAVWQRTVSMLSLAGAPGPGGGTPLEHASAAAAATGIDYRTLREVALHVTRAVYSTREIDESTAQRCEVLGKEIDAACSERLPVAIRVRGLVDPRLMRRRFAG
jgi:hypothetical protein